MRYIIFHMENGYCGCDYDYYMTVGDDATIEDIEEDMEMEFNDYMQEYEHAAQGYSWNEGWEDEESEAEYYEGGYYEWREVDDLEFQEWREEFGY